MKYIYRNSDNNEYRYALGEVKESPKRLLFCFGINPSTATPEKLDPTAKRIKMIAEFHGYDSWIILNICAQRATDPNEMQKCENTNNAIIHSENLKIIDSLLNEYSDCSDILFAYGDLICKRDYLKKNLCDIINLIKSNKYSGVCYCLGKTKKENARHPLYQKVSTPFSIYSLEGHTYHEMVLLEDNKCAIRECKEDGTIIMETFGVRA